MSNPDLVRQVWQASANDPALPNITEVRLRADRFHRTIWRRNVGEYGACIIAIIVCSTYALSLPSLTARIGAAMVVVGTFVVAWQLHRRASAVGVPEGDAASPILLHQRTQLIRQRDALANVFIWYMLPPLPGILVMAAARALDLGTEGLLHDPRLPLAGIILPILVFTTIWWLNRRAARELQKEIDTINKIMSEE